MYMYDTCLLVVFTIWALVGGDELLCLEFCAKRFGEAGRSSSTIQRCSLGCLILIVSQPTAAGRCCTAHAQHAAARDGRQNTRDRLQGRPHCPRLPQEVRQLHEVRVAVAQTAPLPNQASTHISSTHILDPRLMPC